MTLISYALAAVALLLALPVALFVIEVGAAVAVPRRGRVAPKNESGSRQRVAVLVPAHNESAGVLPTLAAVKTQLRPGDRLVVVADNCSDDTAAIASDAGAEVIERNDPSRRGKGYALARGLDHLSTDRPDIVIIIDADCLVADHTIDRLAFTCAATGRPAQSLDLMIAPAAQSPINLKVAEFAWRVKNWVRPLGLMALGLPCQLMGTGMAFPWEVIRSATLATGSIVEDLKLGHDLAMAGYPPVFCPTAEVTSAFPVSPIAAQTQRLRWEQGHIGLILKTAPRLIREAIRRGNWGLLALALDLCIPPLTLLAMLVIGVAAISAIAAAFDVSSIAMTASVVSVAGLALGVFLSWLKFGRDVLPASAIGSAAVYVLAKFGLYGRMLSGKPRHEWIRTERKRQ